MFREIVQISMKICFMEKIALLTHGYLQNVRERLRNSVYIIYRDIIMRVGRRTA